MTDLERSLFKRLKWSNWSAVAGFASASAYSLRVTVWEWFWIPGFVFALLSIMCMAIQLRESRRWGRVQDKRKTFDLLAQHNIHLSDWQRDKLNQWMKEVK